MILDDCLDPILILDENPFLCILLNSTNNCKNLPKFKNWYKNWDNELTPEKIVNYDKISSLFEDMVNQIEHNIVVPFLNLDIFAWCLHQIFKSYN